MLKKLVSSRLRILIPVTPVTIMNSIRLKNKRYNFNLRRTYSHQTNTPATIHTITKPCQTLVQEDLWL